MLERILVDIKEYSRPQLQYEDEARVEKIYGTRSRSLNIMMSEKGNKRNGTW